jgi:hypothetical protein
MEDDNGDDGDDDDGGGGDVDEVYVHVQASEKRHVEASEKRQVQASASPTLTISQLNQWPFIVI